MAKCYCARGMPVTKHASFVADLGLEEFLKWVCFQHHAPYEMRNLVLELSSVRLSLWPSIKDQADHLTLERISLSCYLSRRKESADREVTVHSIRRTSTHTCDCTPLVDHISSRVSLYARFEQSILYIDNIKSEVDVLTVVNGNNILQDWFTAMKHVSETSADERNEDQGSSKTYPKGHRYCAKVRGLKE